jgi:hypothetical protein
MVDSTVLVRFKPTLATRHDPEASSQDPHGRKERLLARCIPTLAACRGLEAPSGSE